VSEKRILRKIFRSKKKDVWSKLNIAKFNNLYFSQNVIRMANLTGLPLKWFLRE
jgi:hypothetical protein